MKRIGILSDTHGTVHPALSGFFSDVDEIWHAGDIGNLTVIKKLREIAPVRAVYGNIDDSNIRIEFPKFLVFQCEEVKVMITHIGGYPRKYNSGAKAMILKEKPGLFVCGHSHILKVMYDKNNALLHINPGAAGNSGMHQVITFVRFVVDGKEMKDLEVKELPRGNG